MRVSVGELLLLRPPVAPEEVRFALWITHKSGDCWAERNTPTWSLSAGLPKQFLVTDLPNRRALVTTDRHKIQTREFLLVVVQQPIAELSLYTLSIDNNRELYFG